MKPKRHTLTDKCLVCGDKASGINYGAVTCETCKIFFFRNKLNLKTFKCKNQAKCVITVATRKQCPKCRLEKCFSIGMRKDSKLKSLDPYCLRSILTCDEKIENDTRPGKALLRRPLISRELTAHELNLISVVQSAVSATFKDETKMEIIGDVSHFVALGQLHWPDIYARKVVRFAKNLPVFSQLNRADQLTMLRESVIEILMVRCAYLLNCENSGYTIVENESSNYALFVRLHSRPPSQDQTVPATTITSNSSAIDYKRKLLPILKVEMNNDPIIRDLIVALLLYQTQENVSCPEYIRYHHTMYSKLLRKYLAAKYPNRNHEERKYFRIINLLNHLPTFKHYFLLSLKDTSEISQIPEVLMEIIKLNSAKLEQLIQPPSKDIVC